MTLTNITTRASHTIIVETRQRLTELIDQFIKGIYFFRLARPQDGVYEIERGDLLSEITIGQWKYDEDSHYESGYTYYVPMECVTTTDCGEVKVKLENGTTIESKLLSTDELQAIAEQLEMTFDDVSNQYKQNLLNKK